MPEAHSLRGLTYRVCLQAGHPNPSIQARLSAGSRWHPVFWPPFVRTAKDLIEKDEPALRNEE